jgi:3-phenylpropionate/trans-cinnamate dioxygenase ferredoxin reductase subunit
MQRNLVIVGGSYAACEMAAAARQNGYEGAIRILTEERGLPYHRPPLSKAFLLGEKNILPIRGGKFYQDNRIDIVFGARAVEIDLHGKRVITAAGDLVDFDQLALAVGARARRLPIIEPKLENILYLRSFADACLLKDKIRSADEISIIGGGFIGLEVASAISQQGKRVTIVETQRRLLMRSVAERTASFLAHEHMRNGVQFLTELSIVKINTHGHLARELVLSNGRKISSDIIVVGIGSQPNMELAQAAGIVCGDGIIVDELGRTSHEGVVAAGDCTFFSGRYTAGGMRLESVQNAIDQSRSSGAFLARVEKPYDSIPWFWSDQYQMKLQIAGISRHANSQVVREDDHGISVFHFADQACVAVETINRPREHMLARKMLSANLTKSLLASTDFALGALRPRRSGNGRD